MRKEDKSNVIAQLGETLKAYPHFYVVDAESLDAEKTSDAEVLLLARSVAAKISQDGAMPGQVRVTVIRETRCVEYAH